MFEKSQPTLDRKNSADGFIQERHQVLIGFNQAWQPFQVRAARHVQIDPSAKGHHCRIVFITANSVNYHFNDRVPVTHYKTWESPFIFEYFSQGALVPGSRRAIDIVERAHHAQHTLCNAGLERRQVHVPHQLFGNPSRVVILSGFHGPVAHEVFCAGGELAAVFTCRLLKASNHSRAHACRKIGVLSTTLGDTSPSRIAAYIEHRSKSPIDSLLHSLTGSNCTHLLRQVGIKRCR